jgi:hypothetical protein
MTTINKNSEYHKNVINVNSDIKKEFKNFASALKVLNVLKPEGTPAKVSELITNAVKYETVFNYLKSKTRLNSKGNCSRFYILQAIHVILKDSTNSAKIEGMIKTDIAKAKAAKATKAAK